MRASWPRTEDLAFEPELAALALLDAALAISVQALIAHNPEMLLGEDTPRARAAKLIVVRYRELAEALDEYRDMLPALRVLGSEDEIPF
jgi:hypothetical protein